METQYYNIITNGETFRVTIKHVDDNGEMQAALPVFFGYDEGFPSVNAHHDGRLDFDTEEEAEVAADTAWGALGRRTRPWRPA